MGFWEMHAWSRMLYLGSSVILLPIRYYATDIKNLHVIAQTMFS